MSDFDATVNDGIGRITITRPEVRNALDSEVRGAIIDRLLAFEDDPDVRVVVFSGEGDNFCAGGDLREFEEFESEAYGLYYLAQSWKRLYDTMVSLDKPIVTQADGHNIGGGMNFLMYSDVVIAADTAKMGVPEIEIGMVTANGSGLLPHRIGLKRALELLLLGELLSGEEAERAGLVTRSVPEDELDVEVDQVATTLAEKSPRTLKQIKEIVYQSLDYPPTAAAARSIWMSYEAARENPDFNEGWRAFLEDREPEWSEL